MKVDPMQENFVTLLIYLQCSSLSLNVHIKVTEAQIFTRKLNYIEPMGN